MSTRDRYVDDDVSSWGGSGVATHAGTVGDPWTFAEAMLCTLGCTLGPRPGDLIHVKKRTANPISFTSANNITCKGDNLRTIAVGAITNGPYQDWEVITGGTSGATGRIYGGNQAAGPLKYYVVSGTFASGEVITGGTSGATSTSSGTPVTIAGIPIIFRGYATAVDDGYGSGRGGSGMLGLDTSNMPTVDGSTTGKIVSHASNGGALVWFEHLVLDMTLSAAAGVSFVINNAIFRCVIINDSNGTAAGTAALQLTTNCMAIDCDVSAPTDAGASYRAAQAAILGGSAAKIIACHVYAPYRHGIKAITSYAIVDNVFHHCGMSEIWVEQTTATPLIYGNTCVDGSKAAVEVYSSNTGLQCVINNRLTDNLYGVRFQDDPSTEVVGDGMLFVAFNRYNRNATADVSGAADCFAIQAACHGRNITNVANQTDEYTDPDNVNPLAADYSLKARTVPGVMGGIPTNRDIGSLQRLEPDVSAGGSSGGGPLVLVPSYLGSWKIGDYVPIAATCRGSTGAANPSSLTCKVYLVASNGNLTEKATVTLTQKTPPTNGFYTGTLYLDNAIFTTSGLYVVVTYVTVSSTNDAVVSLLQVQAEVRAYTLGPDSVNDVSTDDNIQVNPSSLPATDGNGYVIAARVVGDVEGNVAGNVQGVINPVEVATKTGFSLTPTDIQSIGSDAATKVAAGNVAGVTGDTKQTGDAYSAVNTASAAILAAISSVYSRIGAPAGASISADIAAVLAKILSAPSFTVVANSSNSSTKFKTDRSEQAGHFRGWIYFLDGNLATQGRQIDAYLGSGDFSFLTEWGFTATPDVGSKGIIVSF